MNGIAQKRCFNHPTREAAARCPECGRFYCRECVTEHEDRVLCAGCLTRLTGTEAPPPKRLALIFRGIKTLTGLFVTWIFFYYLGQILISIPSTFHEGSIWKEGLW